MGGLRILVWHLNGSWLDAFVRGEHEYLLPTLPDGGPWGGGRRGRNWPASVREVPVPELADTDVDVVVLQRPEEMVLAGRWLRRSPGAEVPAVYVEHGLPRGPTPDARHPMADRQDVWLVHVTHFNELMWDAGTTPTTVIEHGIVDPGYRYGGELARAAVVINEPVRRWRVTGTDLLPRLAEGIELDVFGTGLENLNQAVGLGEARMTPVGDLRTEALHDAMAKRRVYVHPSRWTSLGVALIEAMQLGMPVVALATTEAHEAVPPAAGIVSNRLDVLEGALRRLVADPEEARERGAAARAAALSRFGLARFLADWDHTLAAHAHGARRAVAA
jgi:Glycosyl transferases group 1